MFHGRLVQKINITKCNTYKQMFSIFLQEILVLHVKALVHQFLLLLLRQAQHYLFDGMASCNFPQVLPKKNRKQRKLNKIFQNLFLFIFSFFLYLFQNLFLVLKIIYIKSARTQAVYLFELMESEIFDLSFFNFKCLLKSQKLFNSCL